jgi:drug/metabolite transporter (DMT)-like permease
MPILLIFLCTVTLTVQQVFKKQYSLRCAGGNYFFSASVSFFALLFFLLIPGKISLGTDILPYSAGFAAVFALATVFSVMALTIGSLAITSLVLSYSLIIPTLYGILFLNEKITPLKCGGILLLLISLFLVRAQTKEDNKASKPTVKWIIYVLIAFVANGMCSVVQNAQQRRFNGMQNSNFMILALIISTAVLLVLSIVFERNTILIALKKGAVFSAACGICNGATNYLVMVIIAAVASSVFFPVLSAGQIILTFIISVLAYREKFIPRQIAGLACGLASLVLLNI